MDISPSGGLGVCSSGNGKMWIWDTSNGETRVSVLITWFNVLYICSEHISQGCKFFHCVNFLIVVNGDIYFILKFPSDSLSVYTSTSVNCTVEYAVKTDPKV